VIPVSEGPCTVRIDMADGRSYERRSTIRRVTGECCPGLYIRKNSDLVAVDSGTLDAGANDAPAE
jgi:hypothetical protein